MRPLFPKDLRNDVSIVCTVMGNDYDNSPQVTALNGASIAVAISDIPFNYTVAGVDVGLVDGEFVLNPTLEQRQKSLMDVTVCGTAEKIVMIEAGAKEVPEDQMLDALLFAHEEIKKMCAFIDSIKAEIGKPKFEYEHHDIDHELFDEMLGEEVATERAAEISEIVDKLCKKVVRHWLTQGKRVDGRGMEEVRPLASEVGVLPRAHGTGLFTRGQTQVLSVCTLGTLSDAQTLDTIFEQKEKRYIHHYNFPSFSVGETRPSRGPGRREIGHGALAERSLVPVLPSVEEFPYAIRVVSEVLSSNGSTSQGSVCGSTLALMDAGVPIKAPVAGISCGLITDDGQETTFTDIQGVEDFYGDMDFKVAGTKKGITGIQVDIKVDGLTPSIIKEAFRKCRDARYKILDDVMLKAIAEPRADVSEWAPKTMTIHINPDKIRDVIGKGGAVIQKITAESGAKVDIAEDGTVSISAINGSDGEKAKKMIETIVKDPEVGDVFYGKVVRLMGFGAFVQIAPGKDGLVHISKLEKHRVERVEDVVNVGDMIWVKVIEIDDKGRINLSRKDVKEEEKVL